jgi:hypothetical protein
MSSGVVIGTQIICTERSQQDLIIASIKRTIQLAVMQPPLTRGHVLMEWPQKTLSTNIFFFINLYTIQCIIYILFLIYYRISNTDTINELCTKIIKVVFDTKTHVFITFFIADLTWYRVKLVNRTPLLRIKFLICHYVFQ